MIDKENLTTGSVSRKLIAFALPLLLVNLLQSFYSIVDMLVMGGIVGKTGLAAISSTSMVSFIINSICIGATTGGAVLTVQLKGANDVKGQSETVGTLFSLTLTASGVVTAATLLGYRPLLGLLGIPSDVMKDACEYMEVTCRGTALVFECNGVCFTMKGFGDSKSPLYFVGTATIVNIVLDLLLIGPLGMGAKGAAYTTIFSQDISFAATIIHLERRSFIFDSRSEHLVVKKDKLVVVLGAGLPMAVQMVVVSTSYLLITGMLNQFGVAAVAAFGVGLEINTFAGVSCWAMGQAVTVIAGQSMRASNGEQARETTNTGLCLNLTIIAVTILFVQIFAGLIIRLFDLVSPEVTWGGILYFRTCCGFNSPIYEAMCTFDFFAIGVGSANVAMINVLLDAVVARLSVNWLLTLPLPSGFPSIYPGQTPFPILPAVVGGLYFKSRIWGRGNLIRR